MNWDLINKIKSRGYWRINFHPLIFEKERIKSLRDCIEIINDCCLQLRGWPYPPLNEEKINAGQDFIENEIDSSHHKELWRFYQSAQFIHYRALWEDWLESEIWFDEISAIPNPGEIIAVEGIVFLLTEIFEFVKGLAKKKLYDDGIKINISLVNTEGRRLANTNCERVGFFVEYKSSLYQIPLEKFYKSKDIITYSFDYAVESSIYFFERFKWFPPIKNIQEIQKSFLGRRS